MGPLRVRDKISVLPYTRFCWTSKLETAFLDFCKDTYTIRTRQTCFPCVFNRKDHYHLHLTKRLWRNVKFLYGSWWLVPQPSSFHDPKTIVVLSCVESAFWALHHKFWTMISGEIFGKMFINFDAAVKDTTIKSLRKFLFRFYSKKVLL